MVERAQCLVWPLTSSPPGNEKGQAVDSDVSFSSGGNLYVMGSNRH